MARGAKVRLVKNGKIIHLNHPVQKLFPTEIKHDERECERKENEKGKEAKDEGRRKRAAALDSV